MFKRQVTSRIASLSRSNPAYQRQLTQFVPIAPKPKPFRTILQGVAVVACTVGVWVGYNVSSGKTCFLPMWVSKSKTTPKADDIDLKYVKCVAEEQILERLSLSELIQRQFRLPLKTRLHDDFQVWMEEKDASVKGIEVRPGWKAKFVKKPVNVKADFDVLMENLGGEEKFEIPVINSSKNKDDTYFLGTVTIEGQNGHTADVVFKGIFDREHAKQARITKAHLITVVDGTKRRDILWD
ncbi:Altered inheritance of mitochondria protein 39, mitochondrial [Cyberlindnera fabianii]|uniref:Altered inheritance of mitochondria protein 39, mitochondrial n=1 Tax=Cyberlindnera fabianii TaxID=36022 RepID=A0A1V2LAP0_CYBFA|nr:Altered inheritance of mitochondria protein 39, mitochondrial [Cyberlindnera fabianii]